MAILLFDWGDTLMVDFPEYQGKMIDWPRLEVTQDAALVLSELSQSHQLYVATNAQDSNEDEIRATFERVGLDKYLLGYFCFDTLKISKYQQEYYTKIAEQLGCPTEHLVMIGDNFAKDIEPAQRAGCVTVWLRCDQDSAEYCPKEHAPIQYVTGLKGLLQIDFEKLTE